MRLGEDLGQLVPPRRVVHLPVLVVCRVRREGEQDARLAVLVWEALLEGVEVLAGEDYGLEELLLVLGAHELYVLLEAELELEIALSQEVSACACQ